MFGLSSPQEMKLKTNLNSMHNSNQRSNGQIRNLAVLCIAAGAVLTASHVRGQALFSIDINDSADGAPVVTLSSSLAGAVVTTDFEEASVTVPNFTSFPPLSHSIIFQEPSFDPGGTRVSDYFTVTISPNNVLSVFFASDGAADFGKNLPTNPDATAFEAGAGNTVTAALTIGNANDPNILKVSASSDINSNEVPDATSTLGCLGLGLTALAGFGRKVGFNTIRA